MLLNSHNAAHYQITHGELAEQLGKANSVHDCLIFDRKNSYAMFNDNKSLDIFTPSVCNTTFISLFNIIDILTSK